MLPTACSPRDWVHLWGRGGGEGSDTCHPSLCSEGGSDAGSVQASCVSHREPGVCRRPLGCRWGSLPPDLMSPVGAGCPHSCVVCSSVGGGQWGVRRRDLGDRAGPTPHRGASAQGCEQQELHGGLGRAWGQA